MANRPIRVLHVIDQLGMGGAETWLMELLRFWASREQVQLDFLLTNGTPGIFDEEAQRLGARLHYLRFGRKQFPRFGWQLQRILRQGRYAAIHDHCGYASGWHFLAGSGALPPVRIMHLHVPHLHVATYYATSVLRRALVKSGEKLVQRLATDVCGTAAETLLQYGFKPGDAPALGPVVSVVYCGIDVEKFSLPREPQRQSVLAEFGWPADAKIVLFVGRLDAALRTDDPKNQKNSWFALNIVRAAAERDPAVRLLMAGAGDARAELEDAVRSWGMTERLRLLGIRNDVPRLMRSADALLFPSIKEGLGMVAVEAQAAGLPVLASGGVPKEAIVVPELYRSMSLQVESEQWASTLLEQMAKPRLSDAVCRSAVKASPFSIEESARRLETIYGRARPEPISRSIGLHNLPLAARSAGPVQSQPTRTLQVVSALGMGGAETWLFELLRYWSRTNEVQMDILATSGGAGVFDEEAKALGARIYYVPYGRAELWGFCRRFRQILREGRYHAIHDHQEYASGWHFLMGRGVLPPVCVTHIHNPAYQVRNNYGITHTRRMIASIGRALVARYATEIRTTSRQVIREYGLDEPRFGGIRKAVLHCGFDTDRFVGDPAAEKRSVCAEFGWPENSKVILVAGRLDQSADFGHPRNHKNSGFAVSVGIECARRDSRIRMLFVGRPSLALPVLQTRIAEAGLTDRFHFAGIRRDIARLMLGSDALLFPSRAEGLGMVAVEAQAAGLPVLASTAVPSECAVVHDLVQFKELADGAADWAADLLRLIAQPRDVADANRRVAASPFAIANSASQLLQLYRPWSSV